LIQTIFLKKYFQIYKQAVGKFALNFWLIKYNSQNHWIKYKEL
jgi:hypothetical protein